MIHTSIPRAEADKLVAKGGRILKHALDAKRNPICDVEVLGNGDAGQPPPPPPAKEAPPVVDDEEDGSTN